MTKPHSNQNPSSTGNPSDGYPPTRPGVAVVIIFLGLILVGLGIENRSEISALVHAPQIEKALGL
jgi:hypothetical protein